MLTCLPIKIEYWVELTPGQLLSIMKKDETSDIPLYDILSNDTRVVSIDYDGHFGAGIAFSLHQGDFITENRRGILKIIQDYIES